MIFVKNSIQIGRIIHRTYKVEMCEVLVIFGILYSDSAIRPIGNEYANAFIAWSCVTELE